ncbi:MAG: hypothetical protein HYZ65_13120 [Burkholderiales bacterium]|nr:hypothetical protein [Burkholderiales bacterium]
MRRAHHASSTTRCAWRAGGLYANRFTLNNWYLIGPFEGRSAQSLQTVYPPEMLVDLDAVYFGKEQRVLKWEYLHDTSYPLVPPLRDQNAVYYGYAEVYMEQERDLWVAIGGDDDSKLWFNQKLIWTSGNEDKPWYHTHVRNLHSSIAQLNLTEGQRKLHFNKGRNTFLFKLYNGIDVMFFSLALFAGA